MRRRERRRRKRRKGEQPCPPPGPWSQYWPESKGYQVFTFFTQMVAELVICEEGPQSVGSWSQVALVQILTLLLDFGACFPICIVGLVVAPYCSVLERIK